MKIPDKNKRLKIIFHLTGFIALAWFLIRVIPKPSRANYPCQRAAFPLASSFIIWLIGLCSSILSFRKAHEYFRESKYSYGIIFLIISVVAFGIIQFSSMTEQVFADSEIILKDFSIDSSVIYPKAVVSIIRSSKEKAEDIDSLEIYDMVKQAVELAGGFDNLVRDSMTVVIKPNLLTASVVDDNLNIRSTLPEKINSVTTDYRVIQGVVNLVREKNPHGKIYIMEGSAIGKIRDNMNKMGWFKITGADEIICLDEACGAWRDKSSPDLVKVSLPTGKNLYVNARNEYYLNKLYYEADLLISLPALKTHSNCAVTGAVKNVGIGATPVNIYGSSTANPWRFDVINHTGSNYSVLHDWIHDFYMCRPVDFAIMDGLTGMQNGPCPLTSDATTLKKKNTRCILASSDPLALDAIESLIIQVDPAKVRHLTSLHNDSLGCADPRYIRVKGMRVDEVKDHYSNMVSYANYNDFTAPEASIDSFDLKNNSLFLKIHAEPEVVKVEISVKGQFLPQIYTKDFDKIIAQLETSDVSVHDIKAYVYDKFLNCKIINLVYSGIEDVHKSADFFMVVNYPNPFNPVTKIKYSIPYERTSLMKFVQLKIYDILGNEIETLVNEEKPAGEYEVSFNGKYLSSGIYLCRFNIKDEKNYEIIHKLVLVK